MAENKTKPTKLSVTAFINSIDEAVLNRLIQDSVNYMRKNYETK